MISVKTSLVTVMASLALAVVSCSSAETKEEQETTPTRSSSVAAPATTTAVAQPTAPVTPAQPPPVPVLPANCVVASQDLVDQVNAQLGGPTLSETFVIESPEDYTYVGGNIMEGDKRLSSADVWIAQEGFVTFALSGSAREYTPRLGDGRDLGLSAGDEYGQAVQECTIAALRIKQAGG